MRAIGAVLLTSSVSLLDSLDALCSASGRWPLLRMSAPTPMEFLDQFYGLISYTTQLAPASHTRSLVVSPVRDRVHVLLGNVVVAVLERSAHAPAGVALPASSSPQTLTLLVENSGRVNFGPHMNGERKGLYGAPTVDGRALAGPWTVCRLPLDAAQLGALAFAPAPSVVPPPSFLRGTVQISGSPRDTFFVVGSHTAFALNRGVLFVNGVNLGRYWSSQGPQFALYCPKSVLRAGNNTVTLLELDSEQTAPLRLDTADRPKFWH